jgi:RNA polymerase sigma-70 factor (ECF subfamily)
LSPFAGPRLVPNPPAEADDAELDDVDDATLIARLLNDEAGAAEILWERFLPGVRATVRRLLGPKPEEEDVVQEVFLRFFSTARRLRDPVLARSFIFGICVRVVREEIRRRTVHRWLSIASPEDLPDRSNTAMTAMAEGDHDAREALKRFYRVLDTLSGESRSLFVVRHVEGKELTEVATLHGISVSSVQRKLARTEKCVATMVQNDPLLSQYVSTALTKGRS